MKNQLSTELRNELTLLLMNLFWATQHHPELQEHFHSFHAPLLKDNLSDMTNEELYGLTGNLVIDWHDAPELDIFKTLNLWDRYLRRMDQICSLLESNLDPEPPQDHLNNTMETEVHYQPKVFTHVPWEVFEAWVKTIETEGREQYVKQEILDCLEDDATKEQFHNPENLLRNISEECHDGAYTEDECPGTWFDDDDVDTFYFKLRI